MFSEVPAALDAQFGRAERQAPAYVGQSLEIARRLAEAEHVVQVRVLSLDGDTVSIRQDHRSFRLNLLVAGGEVVRAAFF
jgi:Ser/Thr protein kinase RdoA (MazF antagonist)